MDHLKRDKSVTHALSFTLVNKKEGLIMLKYIFLCSAIAAGYLLYSTFPVYNGPGVMVEEEPAIKNLTWEKPFNFKGAELIPRKTMEAEVQVIKKKRYLFDDFSQYSPIDAVVGWNELSDKRNLDYIYFSLNDRSFDFEVSSPPLELEKIKNKTALWHLIPATAEIDEKIKKIRNGNIIKVKGLLIDLKNGNNFNYKTETLLSSKRNKQGYILWVEFNVR
ncbi:hypothetical protein [Gracilimonas sp.]|uniref:hypothetical protein n=1 Tax=Gracilimonas sp. TaxID=1974203 RepID=UPI00287282BE|nr:hypothetical protein [Gracilimonas sp.]